MAADLGSLVNMLQEATKKGTIRWQEVEGEADTFHARLRTGVVRVAHIVVGNTYLLELVDREEHVLTRAQASPQAIRSSGDQLNLEYLQQIYISARDQSLNVNDKVRAMMDEIERLSN